MGTDTEPEIEAPTWGFFSIWRHVPAVPVGATGQRKATMNRHIDAEQALASLDRTPVVLKNFQGRDWDLYSAMPAKPVFRLLQRRASGHEQDEMTAAESLKMMREMVPAETFDAWLDGGLTIDQVATLMRVVSAAYNGAGASEEGEAVNGMALETAQAAQESLASIGAQAVVSPKKTPKKRPTPSAKAAPLPKAGKR